MMLRVLYVTGLWSGLRDLLFEGIEPRGMPAFLKPLEELIERGHQIDMVVNRPSPDAILNPVPAWLRNVRITTVDWQTNGPAQTAASLAGYYQAVATTLRNENYDFVYAHGHHGALGNLAALRQKVPCGMRWYGTSALTRASSAIGDANGLPRTMTKARALLRHPLPGLAFQLPKVFLLLTDDGSPGDIVQSRLGADRYDFHFWMNGRLPREDWPQPCLIPDRIAPLVDGPYLLYPARLAANKRQDRAIELLSKLDPKSQPVRLLFAGHTSQEHHKQRVANLAKEHGVAHLVEFLGPLSPNLLAALYDHPNCLAVLSLYDVTNRGNVAIEALTRGCVLISANDGSLDSIVQHEKSGLLVNNMDQGACWVARLLREPSLRDALKEGAERAATAHIQTWPERVAAEIRLIERAARVDEQPTRRGHPI